MNMTYHDAKYADLYEETLYNALLGSIDLEGKNFYYQNPLSSSRSRYNWHVCPCCVGNIPRTLLMLPTWTYLKSADSIYVNLFIGITITIEDVAGIDVKMVQTTEYPWNGNVSITVNPAQEKRFSIKIRVPNREVSELYTNTPKANGITLLSVNGLAVTPPIEKGYAVITRDWKAGDKIDLVLPMQIQRVKASEKIKVAAGQVALRYGPLLYNVERVDQDLDKALSSKSPLTSEWKDDFLGGVKVIKGTWADGSVLLAIPNYVRGNRDGPDPESPRSREGQPIRSSVWMKDK